MTVTVGCCANRGITFHFVKYTSWLLFPRVPIQRPKSPSSLRVIFLSPAIRCNTHHGNRSHIINSYRHTGCLTHPRTPRKTVIDLHPIPITHLNTPRLFRTIPPATLSLSMSLAELFGRAKVEGLLISANWSPTFPLCSLTISELDH